MESPSRPTYTSAVCVVYIHTHTPACVLCMCVCVYVSAFLQPSAWSGTTTPTDLLSTVLLAPTSSAAAVGLWVVLVLLVLSYNDICVATLQSDTILYLASTSDLLWWRSEHMCDVCRGRPHYCKCEIESTTGSIWYQQWCSSIINTVVKMCFKSR